MSFSLAEFTKRLDMSRIERMRGTHPRIHSAGDKFIVSLRTEADELLDFVSGLHDEEEAERIATNWCIR